MASCRKFLLGVLATSVALFALNWVLAWFGVMNIGFRTFAIEINVLDKLHQLGFPVMIRPGAWPEATRLGGIIFTFLWWLFYFIIALIGGFVIRRFRFHGTHTV